MRILMHDYGRFAFPLQLSRALAARGHRVRHLYSASVPGPQDEFNREKTDPNNLEITGLRIAGEFAKNTLFRRRAQEIDYGLLAQEHVYQFQPDVVISSNTPLEAQNILQQASRACHSRFIYWVQDLHGLAIWKLMRKRFSMFGDLVGRYYIRFERSLFQRSDDLILITNDLRPAMECAGISAKRLHIIPNWAPLDEFPRPGKNNDWARTHDLCDKRCFVYTGTLALKHNPELLLQLARRFATQPDVRVVVVSSGAKSDSLKAAAQRIDLSNLIVLPFQPREVLPSVLASADVLLAILESDAGEFCVPSKVLTYFCAERPVLLSVPQDNLSAKIVIDNLAGMACSPDDPESFFAAAQYLMNSPDLRSACGQNGLQYARQHFDIQQIANRFETILDTPSPHVALAETYADAV
jgi:colanic acid biosynthesis glycosyl transferase WcaI